jgi:L-2-hydroxyglutarate oxidase LhgO
LETENIHKLYALGKENGVEGLSLFNKSHIEDFEPSIKADFAIYSRETGIIDSHRLMKYYETRAETKGVIISYNSRIVSIENANDWFYISVKEFDNCITKLQSKYVINCAGLHSDKIAQMVGIDIQEYKYRIYPCKGEYFSVSNKYKSKLKHLVYPAPTDISLGIHTVIDLNENLKLGPNAFYVNKIDYNVDPAHGSEFFRSAKIYLPFLREEDISPSMSGIRAKTQRSGDLFRDFIIREEKDKKLPGFINLIGIESPGLTSSPAIAEYISHIVNA